jgi:hypothetical protein
MNRLRKVLLLLGVAAVVLVVSIAGPKTVHAIAATLVQMTNNATNPVGTQDASTTASQIIELHCVQASGCKQVFPDGTTTAPGSVYLVPAGKSFVITAVDILPFPATNQGFPVFANLYTIPAIPGPTQLNNRATWAISSTLSTVFNFPASGIVCGPQTFPEVIFNFVNNSTLGLDNFSANLYGYLTAN